MVKISERIIILKYICHTVTRGKLTRAFCSEVNLTDYPIEWATLFYGHFSVKLQVPFQESFTVVWKDSTSNIIQKDKSPCILNLKNGQSKLDLLGLNTQLSWLPVVFVDAQGSLRL